MLTTTLTQARIATRYNLATKIPKRCFSYEDRGRMRCPLKTEPFHADLMPFPKKKKTVTTEDVILDTAATEYNKNMQLPSTLNNITRYDDLYYNCTRKTGQRRYAQTWVEGPKPTVKPNLLSQLDQNIDPAPIERRRKDERPGTAKPLSSHNRQFHSWYKKFMKK